MIEVTQRDDMGRVKTIGTYTEDEFCVEYANFLDDFSNCDTDTINGHRALCGVNFPVKIYAKVAYNSNGKLLPTDHLVGLVRAYRRNLRKYYSRRWTKKYDCGCKKGTYGWFRRPHTTAERRWTHAWDDEEFAPKKGFARGRRSARNLPDMWDDQWAGSQKCWKRQSKRQHQWKS